MEQWKDEYANDMYNSQVNDSKNLKKSKQYNSPKEEDKDSYGEISDEMSKIEKALYYAWSDYQYQEGNLYSTTFRDGWLMAIEWYKKELKSK